MGKHDQARMLYRQGLVMAPGEPQILNNLGMSHVLTGELEEAERILSQAAASPKATLKTRQNLALVQSLKGKPRPVGPSARLDAPPPVQSDPGYADGAPAEADIWTELQQEG